jgi:predicted anti-sigma-YlaC factor YlaD
MLPFYLESDVSPESRILIDEHLNECERCASFLAGAQSVQSHLRRERTLRANVVDHDRRAQQMISTGQRQLIMLVLAATAGTIAVLIVVGGLVFFLNAPRPTAVPGVPVVPTVLPVDAAPMPVPPLVPTVPPGN